MTNGTPAAPQSAGSAAMRQKTRWAVLGVVVLILIVGGWLLWSGKLGIDISQYFAYETPGYVPPNCGWHGDQISPQYPYCCSGIVQVPVTLTEPPQPPLPLGEPVEMPIDVDCVPVPECAYAEPPCAVDLAPGAVLCPIRTELPPPTVSPPTRSFGDYCVWPECSAVARVVQCVQAPCEPVVEIICPPGVVPPPRPSVPPGPLYDVILNQGQPVMVGSVVPIAWKSLYGSLPDDPVTIWLLKRGWGENRYVVAEGIPNEGRFSWNTDRPVLNAENGSPQDLGNMVGNDLYLYLEGTDGRINGVVSSFTLLEEGPTPTPPSGAYRGVMIGVGHPSENDIIPPATVQPFTLTVGRGVSLPAPPDFYFITGLETSIEIISGAARIVGWDNSDAAFPDIIREDIAPDGQSIGLALGIGTNGEAIRIGNVPFGSVRLEAKVGSDPVCVAVNRLQTDIAAEGLNIDVFDLNYLGGYESQVCVDVGPVGIPGDADGDGDVDIFDYNLVVSNFNTSGPEGDLDGDGDVDIFDYNLVVSNFGTN